MQKSYDAMHKAYTAIFTRLRLKFRSVVADTGAIGGSASEEFHVLADSGEDAIAFSDGDAYAANLEMAVALPPATPRAAPAPPRMTRSRHARAPAPSRKSRGCSNYPPAKLVKTLLVDGAEGGVVALLVRGDHELNAVKAQKLPGVANPLRMASNDSHRRGPRARRPGFSDRWASRARCTPIIRCVALADFVCGANKKDAHFTGVNWGRDLPEPDRRRHPQCGRRRPLAHGQGHARASRAASRSGHIFQLGQKYSESMGASVLDETGKQATLYMGCYGIGVTRVVAAAIEQNHDARGIIWPDAIAPFQVVVVPINAPKSPRVRETAERLYNELIAAGVDALLDDRDERPGVKFADSELIGIPHRVVVGDRGLEKGAARIPPPPRRGGRRIPRRPRRSPSCAASSQANYHGRRHAHPAAAARRCCRSPPHAAPAADAQREPELKGAVQHAIEQAECFEDRYDSAVWYKMMEPRLRNRVPGSRRAHGASSRTCSARPTAPAKSRIPPGTGHGHHRHRERLQPLRGVVRGRGRPHAGHAVLARNARHAPPPAHPSSRRTSAWAARSSAPT